MHLPKLIEGTRMVEVDLGEENLCWIDLDSINVIRVYARERNDETVAEVLIGLTGLVEPYAIDISVETPMSNEIRDQLSVIAEIENKIDAIVNEEGALEWDDPRRVEVTMMRKKFHEEDNRLDEMKRAARGKAIRKQANDYCIELMRLKGLKK